MLKGAAGISSNHQISSDFIRLKDRPVQKVDDPPSRIPRGDKADHQVREQEGAKGAASGTSAPFLAAPGRPVRMKVSHRPLHRHKPAEPPPLSLAPLRSGDENATDNYRGRFSPIQRIATASLVCSSYKCSPGHNAHVCPLPRKRGAGTFASLIFDACSVVC